MIESVQSSQSTELFFIGGSDVITSLSRDLYKFLYLQLWADYSHQIWTAVAPTLKESIGHYCKGDRAMIMWLWKSEDESRRQLLFFLMNILRTIFLSFVFFSFSSINYCKLRTKIMKLYISITTQISWIERCQIRLKCFIVWIVNLFLFWSSLTVKLEFIKEFTFFFRIKLFLCL